MGAGLPAQRGDEGLAKYPEGCPTTLREGYKVYLGFRVSIPIVHVRVNICIIVSAEVFCFGVKNPFGLCADKS